MNHPSYPVIIHSPKITYLSYNIDIIPYYMNKFFKYFRLLMSLIIAVIIFYISLTAAFPSAIANIVLFVVGIFLLLLNLGRIDEQNGFGDDDDDSPQQQPPQPQQ